MTISERSTFERKKIIRNLYDTGDRANPFYPIIKQKVKTETAQIKQSRKLLVGDLHTHTLYSDGMNTIDQIICEAKARGLDIVAVTDHELTKVTTETKTRLYSQYFSQCKDSAIKHGIIVVPGIEVTSTEGHILSLFPTYQASAEVSKIMHGLSPEETVEQIHHANGTAIAAHLYRKSGLRENISRIRKTIDGAELNSPHSKFNTAYSLGIALVAGSDTHSRIGLGSALTLFPSEDKPPTSVENRLSRIIELIKNRKTEIHLISSSDLLRNLDKTRWLSPFYASKNMIERFNDEERLFSRRFQDFISQ